MGGRIIHSINLKDLNFNIRLKKEQRQKIVPIKADLELKKLKNFHLLELSLYREKYFKDFIIKEFYLSLLPNTTKLNTSNYIKPSLINKRYDDYEKGEISKFDWIVLDEFYNNKNLKDFMFYKTEVIPILTEAIYKRLQGIDDE